MNLRIIDGLLYVSVTVTFEGRTRQLEKVILDTGSAGTVFSADELAHIGVIPQPADVLYRIRGVGGSEFVVSKKVDELAVGDIQVSHFDIEIGAMQYGFDLDGLIGTDFLLATHSVIDLDQMELRRA